MMDIHTCLFVLLSLTSLMAVQAGNFDQDVDLTWGDNRAKIINGGKLLRLSLDKSSGSGFRSKREYLFARIDMQIKLVSGHSAGTVAAFYLSSEGAKHDEIDFEFLGNITGQPYTVHTNVYAQGEGDREQQFHLWFDPTKNFHTYSILWNPQSIIFLVDNTPIRVYNNMEQSGIPFPTKQPMRVYSSLWDAEDWATRGGLVKTDWSKAPFTAYYRNFNAISISNINAWQSQGLDANGRRRLRWVQKHYRIYDYCSDLKRFSTGRPKECRLLSH